LHGFVAKLIRDGISPAHRCDNSPPAPVTFPEAPPLTNSSSSRSATSTHASPLSTTSLSNS